MNNPGFYNFNFENFNGGIDKRVYCLKLNGNYDCHKTAITMTVYGAGVYEGSKIVGIKNIIIHAFIGAN